MEHITDDKTTRKTLKDANGLDAFANQCMPHLTNTLKEKGWSKHDILKLRNFLKEIADGDDQDLLLRIDELIDTLTDLNDLLETGENILGSRITRLRHKENEENIAQFVFTEETRRNQYPGQLLKEFSFLIHWIIPLELIV